MIETLSEGLLSELHIGMKGSMNGIFIKDLGDKTRRSLMGRALAGKCAGGKAYGYKNIVKFTEAGDPIKGDRTIVPTEAVTINALVEAILGNSLRVFVDETPIPIIVKGKGETGKAYMYAVHRDDRPFGGNVPTATFFATRDTRAGYHIEDMFAGRSLIAQHDGNRGYAQFGRVGTAVEHVVSAACWAHARRNFIKYYQSTGSESAREIIDLIDELFRFERDINGLSQGLRKQERGRHQRPIVQKILTRLEEIKPKELKNSKLGKAIEYMLKRQESLSLFPDNGHVDLDTNAVERQFKPIQMLRKNVYFMGSDEGGETWAVFSSLIETCKLNGVDPYRYLVWVFDELATLFHRKAQPVIDYRKFLPWNAPENCRVEFKSDVADQSNSVPFAA